ncbi:MAG: prolipoprotein diacylglyceryl transferase [Sandaracinaceae bacterium]
MRDLDVGYVAIMASAFGLAMLARRWAGDGGADPLTRGQRFVLSFAAVVGGALSAKLPYVLADPAGAVSGAAWLTDGRTVTWGLVGGYFAVELAKPFVGVRTKTGDGFAVPVAVSIGVGRLGCLWAGCCYGAPTDLPWGVDFGDGVLRHPNQLYEAAFHLGMAGFLLYCGRRGWLARQRIKVYIASYMAFRLVSESWRPEPRIALGLTFYQWSALVFLALFVGLFLYDRYRADRYRQSPVSASQLGAASVHAASAPHGRQSGSQ